jgi:hypothetical protein
VVLQPKPPSKRNTKRNSLHLFITEEHLSQGLVVVDLGNNPNVLIGEIIINSSLALLIPKDGSQPQAFCDLVSLV